MSNGKSSTYPSPLASSPCTSTLSYRELEALNLELDEGCTYFDTTLSTGGSSDGGDLSVVPLVVVTLLVVLVISWISGSQKSCYPHLPCNIKFEGRPPLHSVNSKVWGRLVLLLVMVVLARVNTSEDDMAIKRSKVSRTSGNRTSNV